MLARKHETTQAEFETKTDISSKDLPDLQYEGTEGDGSKATGEGEDDIFPELLQVTIHSSLLELLSLTPMFRKWKRKMPRRH